MAIVVVYGGALYIWNPILRYPEVVESVGMWLHPLFWLQNCLRSMERAREWNSLSLVLI